MKAQNIHSIALSASVRISEDSRVIAYAGKDEAYNIAQKVAGDYLTKYQKYENTNLSDDTASKQEFNLVLQAREIAAQISSK
jgi:hypothetical protein